MADLVITAANVVHDINAQYNSGVAGVSITAGQLLYLDPVSGLIKLADADSSITTAAAIGVALHAATANEPIKYQTSGDINLGATLVVGGVYVVSATPGATATTAALATGWYTNIVGVARTASLLTLMFAGPSTLVPHA
jgi:hypothetical protein